MGLLDLAIGHGMGLALAAGAVTVPIVRKVLAYLRQRQILDRPNERSSHGTPTPRGGGLATTPVLAGALLSGWFLGWDQAVLGIGALILLAVSWLDDRNGLPPLPRFATQVVVIAASLALLPVDWLVFQGWLPLWADRLLAGLGWLWFVNLYNFMDGVDGITGVESIALGMGIALIAALDSATGALIGPALTVAAVAAAFLCFNWHPAKLFLGDSGSIPLGYVLGGLLIALAGQGQLAAALILPAYYLADATITLTRRALNREKIWLPHRKHFYQRAVQGGKRHDQVVLVIAAGNVVLLAAALWAALGHPGPAALLAVTAVAGLLGLLQAWSGGRARS